MTLDHFMPYLKPVFVQVALTALQILGALCLSSAPRICSLANASIAAVGKRVNVHINNSIKDAVDRVFGDAFKQVKETSDEFFPKFKKATQSLRKAMETAGKAQAMVGGAMGAAKGIGSII